MLTSAFINDTAQRFFFVLGGVGAATLVYGLSFRMGDKGRPRNPLSRGVYDFAPLEARIGAAMLIVGAIGLIVAYIA